jgi:NodT family efflux transporter outer membrane factor (OMF) lipoprotein
MRPLLLRATALAAIAALIAGCVVGPDYVKPATPAPDQPGGGKFAASAPDTSTEAPLPADWWRLYNDATLNDLVREALANNKTLLQAAANLAQARAALSEARAARTPSTDFNAGAQYGVSGTAIELKNFANTLPNSTGQSLSASGPPSPQGFYSYGLDASYEVDLFGRITRSIQAAKADRDAQAAALDYTRVSVAGETTRAYLNACAYAQEAAVAQRAVQVVQQTLQVTQATQAAGGVGEFEVTQQRGLLQQTQASLPGYEAERRSALFQLAVLTGRAPEDISKAADSCKAPPTLSQLVPVGDGQALIRRRPDVRQAERRLAGDVSRIGVATADLYPTISLGGSAQIETTRLSQLASVGSLSYLLGPLISWSVPNTLVAQARIREARAAASASLASFQQTVLQALQDVETSLVSYQGELRRNHDLKGADDAQRHAFQLVQVRYREGSASFLDLLNAETNLVNADLSLADSDELLASDQATVFKALGGGWEQAPAVVPLGIPDGKKGGAATPVK